jgi:hypothetical protein
MATKSEILFKVVGQNVKVVVDGETLTRKIADKEERDILKSRVIAYNSKPLVKEKKAIIAEMSKAKVEAKAIKAIEAKQAKVSKPSKKALEVIEKAPELTKEEQIAQAKKLLEDNNFTVNAKQTPQPYRRSGEH